MSILKIVKDNIFEQKKIQQLIEGKKKNRNKAKEDDGDVATKEKPEPQAKGITTGDAHTIVYSKKFKDVIVKKANKPANNKKVYKAIDDLKKTGSVESVGGGHSINQPVYSEHTSSKETGWVVFPISTRDDYRFAYLKHKTDKVIEVKIGSAKDIGYDH